MVDISLVEITSKQTPAKTGSQDFLGMFSAPQRTSFMTSLMTCASGDAFSVEASKVGQKVLKWRYEPKTPYTVIFLYDFIEDSESRDFVSLYGGKLHNRSSAGVTILTFFSSYMADNWSNVQLRDEIRPGEDDNSAVWRANLILLKNMYQVKKLPAMVLVKKENNGTESSCVVDFSGFKKDGMYKTVEQVIDTINDNFENDFSVLASKICGPDSKITHDKGLSSRTAYDFIGKLVKEEKKKTGRSYTQDDLAGELGISRRTLTNKRSDLSFTRDECFMIALRFALEPEKLNELLWVNGQQELGIAGRDGIIRLCLLNGLGIDETNRRLRAGGYEPLR